MRYVFLFPGQGSQTHRMGFELYRDLPECRRVFDQAGDEIKSRIFEGRAADLQKTEHLQPAISVVNAACLAALVERGVRADAVAGHSLGEYSAAYAAGVLELEELIVITTKRGALMAAAAATSPGSMLAVSDSAMRNVPKLSRNLRASASSASRTSTLPIRLCFQGNTLP